MWFKKKEQAPVNEKQVLEQPKRYSDDIEQIHSEFMGAADKLFLEATSILAECEKKDTGKFKRLLSLGFKQVPQVVEGQEVLRKEALSKETIQFVNYYKMNYPNNKFITEEMVKQICFKYNLVCGGVDRYKGFVPEKNLRDIEKFELKPKDQIIIRLEITESHNGGNVKLPLDYIDERHLTTEGLQYLSRHASRFYICGSNYDHTTNIVNRSTYELFKHLRFVRADKVDVSLQICAPLKDMDTSGMKIEDGYKLKKHIPDPVVLQPVKGGYLIITAWGDEASDPLVVNESNN